MNKILRCFLVIICSFLFITSVSAKNKITMYFFHGDGCPHCAAEEKFIEENEEIFKDVKIVKYEVWKNKDNMDFLKKVASKFDFEAKSIPFNVIGNTVITGFSESAGTENKIINTIYYYQDHDYVDYVKEVLDDNMDVVELNQDAISYTREGEEDKTHVIKVPLLGEVNLENISLGFATVLIGLIDGFNPCAMWVLLFLISVLIGMKDKKRMLIIGFTFLLASALVYMAIMLSWINIVVKVSTSILFRNIIAVIALIGGIINLRGYVKSLKDDSGCEVVDDKKRKKIFTKIKKFTKEKSLGLALIGVIGFIIYINYERKINLKYDNA